MGSWVMSSSGDRWIDPLAIWHNKRSCLGYADGHAVKHKWVDKSTIEMAEKALIGTQGAFNITPPAGEGEDLRFMFEGYQLWPTRRPWP